MISKIRTSIEDYPLRWASGWTVLIIMLLSIPGRDIPSVGITGIDKPVHAGLFFVFTILWARALPLSRRASILVAAGLALAFGVASEFYQGILPFERIPDKWDVLADWVGVIGALIVLVWRWRT